MAIMGEKISGRELTVPWTPQFTRDVRLSLYNDHYRPRKIYNGP